VKPVRQLVPLATAAAELSVSQRTLRRWISCGLLPAYRTGNQLIRIDRADLDKVARPIPTAGTSGAA
jgi:excisionase family DNA binding protein